MLLFLRLFVIHVNMKLTRPLRWLLSMMLLERTRPVVGGIAYRIRCSECDGCVSGFLRFGQPVSEIIPNPCIHCGSITVLPVFPPLPFAYRLRNFCKKLTTDPKPQSNNGSLGKAHDL